VIELLIVIQSLDLCLGCASACALDGQFTPELWEEWLKLQLCYGMQCARCEPSRMHALVIPEEIPATSQHFSLLAASFSEHDPV
jgi:hypothetical protein